MSAEQRKGPLIGGKSPKAGCAIILIIATIVITLITITISLPFIQVKKMQPFTEEQPAKLSTMEPLKSPPTALQAKIAQQHAELQSATEPVTLTYTTAELNNAIRSYDLFSELQGTLAVKTISPEKMEIDISFPLNTNPFKRDQQGRFLNALLYATVEKKNDELILKVSEAHTDAGLVPEGFTQHLREYRVMQPYTDHEVIGRVMFGAKEIVLGEESLSITVAPSEYTDPESIKPAEDDSADRKKRRTWMPLMSFLMVGGAFFFMVRRRNAKEAKKWQELADREE